MVLFFFFLSPTVTLLISATGRATSSLYVEPLRNPEQTRLRYTLPTVSSVVQERTRILCCCSDTYYVRTAQDWNDFRSVHCPRMMYRYVRTLLYPSLYFWSVPLPHFVVSTLTEEATTTTTIDTQGPKSRHHHKSGQIISTMTLIDSIE